MIVRNSYLRYIAQTLQFDEVHNRRPPKYANELYTTSWLRLSSSSSS
jgi:hypothetical protein